MFSVVATNVLVVVVAVAAADKIGDEAELAAVTRDYYLSVAPCFVGS